MLLHDALELAAVRTPDAPAVLGDGPPVSFAELAGRVRTLAAGVRRHSAPGDRVAVLADNRPELLECYYGVPAAGRTLTLLNTRLHPREWATTLADAEPSLLVAAAPHLERLAPDLGAIASLRHVVALDDPGAGDLAWSALAGPGPDPGGDEPPVGTDASAWLIHTSGTTGTPKGVVLTHRGLLAAALNTALRRPVAPDDVYLFPFPMYHVAGYNLLLFHLLGRPVVLASRFDPEGFCQQVERHRVTATSLAPTMIALLLDHPATRAADLSSLRAIGYGASAIPAPVLRRGLAELGCDFAQGYGMTELSGNAAFLSGADHRRGAAGEERLLRAAGWPGPLAAIRVVDDDDRDVPTGEPGEIVVRGDQVTPGYWRNPDATAAAVRDGWFHTGDVGRLDADGLLTVVDRKKDLIVTGGENVASREVEEVLYGHPGVRDVAVVGVPDETWGERVCAVVVARSGMPVSADELVALSRDHLAGYKTPRRIVFVAELPKNSSGKVLKDRVRALVPEADTGAA